MLPPNRLARVSATSPSREIFEYAARWATEADAFSILVDNDMAERQKTLMELVGTMSPFELAEYAHPHIKLLENEIETFLAKLDKTTEAETISSIRLRFLAQTIDITMLWPLLALYSPANKESHDLRAGFSESMYGLAALALGPLLEEYDGPENRNSHIPGAINELTLVALGARSGNANRITLLSDSIQDRRDKVDTFSYFLRKTRDDDGSTHSGFAFNVRQVKTSGRIPYIYGPDDPIIIKGTDLGNTDFFDSNGRAHYKTARTIYREVAANDTRVSPRMASQDAAYLDSVLQRPAVRSIYEPDATTVDLLCRAA